jgi:hypothetical protein
MALHFMHYNFCPIHRTQRVTPAMEAGISDHVWDVQELAALMAKPNIRTARAVQKEGHMRSTIYCWLFSIGGALLFIGLVAGAANRFSAQAVGLTLFSDLAGLAGSSALLAAFSLKLFYQLFRKNSN